MQEVSQILKSSGVDSVEEALQLPPQEEGSAVQQGDLTYVVQLENYVNTIYLALLNNMRVGIYTKTSMPITSEFVHLQMYTQYTLNHKTIIRPLITGSVTPQNFQYIHELQYKSVYDAITTQQQGIFYCGSIGQFTDPSVASAFDIIISLNGSLKKLKNAGHNVFCQPELIKTVKAITSQNQDYEFPRGNIIYQRLKSETLEEITNEALKLLRKTWFEDYRAIGSRARRVE